mgnify:CR=1 FL=1
MNYVEVDNIKLEYEILNNDSIYKNCKNKFKDKDWGNILIQKNASEKVSLLNIDNFNKCNYSDTIDKNNYLVIIYIYLDTNELLRMDSHYLFLIKLKKLNFKYNINYKLITLEESLKIK